MSFTVQSMMNINHISSARYCNEYSFNDKTFLKEGDFVIYFNF